MGNMNVPIWSYLRKIIPPKNATLANSLDSWTINLTLP